MICNIFKNLDPWWKNTFQTRDGVLSNGTLRVTAQRISLSDGSLKDKTHCIGVQHIHTHTHLWHLFNGWS